MNYWKTIIIIFISCLLLSVPFWVYDLDIKVQQQFFDRAGGWYLQDAPFWKAIYLYGVFPGLLVALISLFAIGASYWNVKFSSIRKPALFLVFSLVLGPGLLVNLIFKDHYGRPRPREIVEFGGTEAYAAPLVYSNSGGKSFPCGHGAIGFYLALPFLFLRKTNKKLAYIILVTGTLFGILISYARVISGGHFTSDVFWAAGMVWMAALAVASWLRLHEPVKQRSKAYARRMFILIGVLLPIITVGLLLATPYFSSKQIDLPRDTNHLVTLKFEDTIVQVKEGEDLSIQYEVNGFGFPNSRVEQRWMEEEHTFMLEKSGWFSELSINATITVPEEGHYLLKMNEGKLILQQRPSNLEILVEGVDILNK